MSNYDTTTDKAITYLNDIKARERLENSEYNRLIDSVSKRDKRHRRNLALTKRIERVRDDTLEAIIKRNSY